MSALADWLDARGLGALHAVLAAQQIDIDVLPDLTEDDLKGLGIALGPRRRLLKAIAGAFPAPSPSDADPAVDFAERRQLSVLFVDLVGSTALTTQRDPEEMRQIVRRYQNAVAGEVARFDGYVAKFMGDGVLAYFGWPKAHEDEAERAVRAAMAAVAAVAELRTGDGETLAARAGIATGLVVVGGLIGQGAAQEAAVIGATPNIAARLQDLAKPGQVIIADSTQKFVQSSFDLVPLGRQPLKGLEHPVAIFAVERERSSDSRFEARAGRHLRPMVGRDQELALLGERWAQVRSGEGQCVLLVGEAGIGKSRITRALRDMVGAIRQRHPALSMLALSSRQRLVAADPADDRCPEDSGRGPTGDTARQDRNLFSAGMPPISRAPSLSSPTCWACPTTIATVRSISRPRRSEARPSRRWSSSFSVWRSGAPCWW